MPVPPRDEIDAFVFDAYGTLFDLTSPAARLSGRLGGKADALGAFWRIKQIEYTWQRSLMGCHADFWQVTGESLDFALESLEMEEPALREDLMQLYMKLEPYPEVKGVLARLKGAGLRTAILSNGSPAMLASAVENAGIGGLLDAVLSVEEVGIFKPHPRVYQLAVDRLGAPAGRICFQSSNAWDAAGASHFGLRVVWVNRFAQTREKLPQNLDAEIKNLEELADQLGV